MEDAHHVEAASDVQQRSTKQTFDSRLEQQKYVLDVLKSTIDPASKKLDIPEAIKKIDMLYQASPDTHFKDTLSRLSDYIQQTSPSELTDTSKLHQLIDKAALANADASNQPDTHAHAFVPPTTFNADPFAAKVPESTASAQSHNQDDRSDAPPHEAKKKKRLSHHNQDTSERAKQASCKSTIWTRFLQAIRSFFS